ncbi:primosomal protein N' [Stenotrophobium rhamnosiphilum]|uniref:Replication restart protein PriA n=1 Tax=Stenotrophobium rhamnosiphilum TaxID=2029166 RepID=A0A2T5MFU1_9GAMM|nr:primosomal protein N' [Stenotrophobium rhamnosiphilum]PTU31444.1 primosomal protein N' [Stenotrophobium rhamnosiphilum]
MTVLVAAIAIPAPIYRLFDYRVPAAAEGLLVPGMRVRVPFGRRRLVAVVAEPPREIETEGREYKFIEVVLDQASVFPADLWALCRWAADYYQYPLGEVLSAALPGPLRRGDDTEIRRENALHISESGRAALETLPARSHAQRAVLQQLATTPCTRGQLLELLPKAAASLRKAMEMGWLLEVPLVIPDGVIGPALAPTPEQVTVVEALRSAAKGFSASLLEGVTGSGKTEVYLCLAADAVTRGEQVLVLVPEIGLTPQLLARFNERFGAGVASFHSGMSENERADTWLRARAGEARIVIGTRSAVFVPFAKLGLIVIDEEHDASYKQQDSFRYSARDLAILRAQKLEIPVLLGSATPSLETLHNARSGRYRHLKLESRVRQTAPPKIHALDVRTRALDHGLSHPLLEAIDRHLTAGGQALLFINRRGFAPVLLCHDCGWSAPCARCDAHMTLHRGRGRLVCHHCGAQQKAPTTCPTCNSKTLTPVGQGTERVEEALRARFPDKRVERFDSDRLRRAGELERLLADIRSGEIHILVGTQILAKGHDFAGLTLVGIVSADQALYGTDFRAIERMGQMVTQVAGRAGRGAQQGEVILQTHEPEHPLLRTLVEGGYIALSDALLEERRMAGLPPFSHLALLRAEATQADAPLRFLNEARNLMLADRESVQVSDAIPATMEKRAGNTRAQLLLQSASRAVLQRKLSAWVGQFDSLPSARQVRWSLDVDPGDLY